MCLQGLIDVTKELQKLQEKVTRIEKENARLRHAVSELTLDKQILKEALSGNY